MRWSEVTGPRRRPGGPVYLITPHPARQRGGYCPSPLSPCGRGAGGEGWGKVVRPNPRPPSLRGKGEIEPCSPPRLGEGPGEGSPQLRLIRPRPARQQADDGHEQHRPDERPDDREVRRPLALPELDGEQLRGAGQLLEPQAQERPYQPYGDLHQAPAPRERGGQFTPISGIVPHRHPWRAKPVVSQPKPVAFSYIRFSSEKQADGDS